MVAVRHLGFLKRFTIPTACNVRRFYVHHHVKIGANRTIRCGHNMTIFYCSRCRNGKEGRTALPCQISSKSLIPRPIYFDFPVFKMVSAAIFCFWNFKFVTVGTVKRVELRHLAKFCVILGLAVLVQYRRVTDGRTDTRWQQVRASIASRGKKAAVGASSSNVINTWQCCREPVITTVLCETAFIMNV